jgi:leucyl aminopeptidase (aminopeptidase T)
MDRVWAGVDRLLDDYAEVGKDQLAVVAYTPDSREPAAWITTGLRTRGVETRVVAMRPFEDPDIQDKLDAVLPSPEQAAEHKFVIFTVERDTMSHTGVIRDSLAKYDPDRWLAARIISASEEFFTHAMNASPGELSRINTALLERLMNARQIRVTTAAGTDLTARFEPDRYRWLSNRGVRRPGGMMILPAGEVATYPASVDGVLVADGAFNANVYTRIDARLGEHPPTIRIEGGVAVDFSCADSAISELIRLCFTRPNATRVGELGFGSNRLIPGYIPMNSHINERRPGLHLGFGQHNQPVYAMDYDCDIHLDLIARGALVWVDQDPEPFDVVQVAPSAGAHPAGSVMDEDIDGDCCGRWLSDMRAGQCVARAVPPPET